MELSGEWTLPNPRRDPGERCTSQGAAMDPANEDVTDLLHEASGGNRAALDRLVPLVYDELRGIAQRQRRVRDRQLTLNTTGLVHEAYMKLVDQSRATWQNRAHFFAVAARLIRRLIVDAARERLAQKRGGNWKRVPLAESAQPFGGTDEDPPEAFVRLDEALHRLALLDARQADIVTYRFFGGLTVEETAEVMDLSPATVKRDWSMARAWLHRELRPDGGPR